MVTYENDTSVPTERLLQPHELSMADRAFFLYAEAASFLFKPSARVIETAVSALPKDILKKIGKKITTLEDLTSFCRNKGLLFIKHVYWIVIHRTTHLLSGENKRWAHPSGSFLWPMQTVTKPSFEQVFTWGLQTNQAKILFSRPKATSARESSIGKLPGMSCKKSTTIRKIKLEVAPSS